MTCKKTMKDFDMNALFCSERCHYFINLMRRRKGLKPIERGGFAGSADIQHTSKLGPSCLASGRI